MKPAFVLACALAMLPAAAAGQREPLRLSLRRAVELALAPEGNTRIQLAEEALKQAQSRSAQARAALLPDFEVAVAQQRQTRNLAAMGIRFDAPVPGFSFPTVVGPFNTFDVRTSVHQTVFDFSSIRRFQASRAGVEAATADRSETGEEVAAHVSRAYVSALRAEAELDAVRANIALAEAVLKQAEDQKTAGTGTGIEITRARVQLASEQQRLLVSENNRRAAHLQLLRAMALRLDTPIELTDTLGYEPAATATLEEARAEALKSRADLRAQVRREDAARLSSQATRMERLPSVFAFADYGSIGSSINSAVPTRAYGLGLKIPIFDGGRRDARRGESASQYRQERARTHDLREQIELEVRLAYDSLRSAEEQVQVAEGGLALAESEFNQARRRYEAGVAAGLEVTDAQTRLERARDNRIAALFNYNLARIDLAQALGQAARQSQD